MESKGAKKMAVTTEPKAKPVRVDLDPAVHQQFRVEAAKEGVSMAAMGKRIIEEWVAKRKSSGK